MLSVVDAKVLFEYEKTQEDELSLKVGQIIHNVVQVGQEGGGRREERCGKEK